MSKCQVSFQSLGLYVLSHRGLKSKLKQRTIPLRLVTYLVKLDIFVLDRQFSILGIHGLARSAPRSEELDNR